MKFGPTEHLLLISGPCQIESLDHALMVAEKLKEICNGRDVQLVYKSSYDKANRTSLGSKRGPGIEEGLKVLQQVKEQFELPVLTDVHHPEEVPLVAEVADIIQIPAFLCRQTDLLVAAGKSGKTINLKKGQFLHPADMQHCAEKITSQGNSQVLLCERGTCFGYRDLMVDVRGLAIMKGLGYSVVFDATHSVQSMGGAGGSSGGSREFIEPLTRAAVAAGVDGLFIETHEEPERAPSDGASMLPIDSLSGLLDTALRLRNALAN